MVDIAILLIAFIVSFFLALFTLLKNPRSSTNRLFFIFTLIISSYLLANYTLSNQPTDVAALFWVKIVMSLAASMNISFFLLASTFPNYGFLVNKKVLTSSLIFTIFILIAIQLNLLFTSAKAFGAQGNPGPAMPFFLVHTILLLGSGFYILVRKYIKSHGIEKAQIGLFLLGAIIMFVSILVTNLFFVLILNTGAFIGLLPIYTSIFVGFISYAIVRHRFLDIRLIVVRSVGYFLLISTVALAYGLSLFIITTFITNEQLRKENLITSVIVLLLATFSFQPLRTFLEKITNKFLYKQHYEANILLSDLSHIMASTLTLSDLSEGILNNLLREVRLVSGYIILMKNDSIIWAKSAGENQKIDLNEKDLSILIEVASREEQDNILIFDELPESKEKEIMRNHSITILLPLKVKDERIGALMLGGKASGDIYSIEDINVLKILAPEVAVAVKNSLSYEEIRKFNITLEKEVKSATSDLEKANIKLKELDKLKDEFVSVASHELRTPMTSVKSYLWMALNGKGGDLNEKQKYYLDRAYMSTDRLIKLVNDMLNVSRIEAGRVALTVEKVDMIKLADDVIGEVKPRADELGLTIKVTPFENLPSVVADVNKIKEVLINLLGNSLKFTPRGGVIEIYFETKPGTVITNVKDNGKGVEKSDQSKLFEKFGLISGSYTTTTISQGTGLGLYICKSIITYHKGEIWAQSEGRDKGSIFSFSLKQFDPDIVKIIQSEQEGKEGKDIIHSTV